MALRTNIHDTTEFLYQFIGAGDEVKWNKIKKAIDRGTAPHVIKTGISFQFPAAWDPNLLTFSGIEGEGRFVGAPGMDRGALAINRTNGCPRVTMPDAADSTIYVPIELEEWWLPHPLFLQYEWVNDHSGTGNVRMRYVFRQINIGQQGPATATTLLTRTVNEPALAAGLMTTSIIANLTNVAQPNPGPLAAYYDLEITRLGTDGGNDTHGGPIGIAAVSWVHYVDPAT